MDRGAGELGHRVLITLVVFAAFSALYLGHPLGPSQYIGFGFIALGAFFVFR